MTETRSGSCLCGAVWFTARLKGDDIEACHCTQCQRWTGGGPYMAVAVEEMTLGGEDALQIYRASDWAERATCKTCGSPVFWRMKGRQAGSVPAGLLDDQSGLTVTEEIFVDHRPGWLPAWPGAAQRTEDEMFAKLRAALEGDRS